MGNTAGEKQLPNFVEIDISEDGRKTLSNYDWNAGLMQNLYKLMDLKLKVLFLPLKRILNLLNSLRKAPQETHVQYMERVKNSMLTGGIGSISVFSLTWDRLLIVLILKGLPNSDQCKIC